MSKIIDNEQDLHARLKDCSRLFVLFYASWCPHSRRFLPVFEKYASGGDEKFCRVITDQSPECEETYSIDVVPTVIYFENGRVRKRLDGVPGIGLTENDLDSLVRSCEPPTEPGPKART